MRTIYYERLEMLRWFLGKTWSYEKIREYMDKLGYKHIKTFRNYILFKKGKDLVSIDFEVNDFNNLLVKRIC